MHWYMEKHKVPKTMPRLETEALLSELREISKSAKMDAANFGDATEQIKAQTKLYRETWLVSPLDNLIKRYKDAGHR